MTTPIEPAEGKTMFMVVVFRSGAQIRVPVTKFTVGESAYGNSLASLEWGWDEGVSPKLKYIDTSEVAAVLREDE